MKILARYLTLAVAAAAFLAFTQRRQINAARTALARLEASPVVHSTNASPALPASDGIVDHAARLRSENRAIHGLRGQISQAREKRKAFEQMQAENARLRGKIDRLKANPNEALIDPFQLSNKGQSTPDAALETTFWSMYQGDLKSLARAMPLVAAEFERIPPEEKTNSITTLRAMAATIGKLEILDRVSKSPDEVHLTVRFNRRPGLDVDFTSDHGQSTFVLRRTNDIWQVISER